MREQIKALCTSRFGISLLGLVLSVVFLHFIILAYYISQHEHFTRPGVVDYSHPSNYALLRLIWNANQTMQLDEFKEILNRLNKSKLQINNNHISMSLTSYPVWPLQFGKNTPWQTIVKELHNDIHRAKYFSYLLKNGQWLNYKITAAFTIYQATLLFMMVEILLLGFILFYGWSIMRFVIPLHRFKDSAERLGIDVNTTPVSTYGPAIVQETANAMNKMQQRIQELINTRTKMLAAISHDLRTPITRLKLRTQFLSDEAQANKINKDLDEMENLISGILSFAQNDVLKETKLRFDINSLIASICYDYTDMGYSIEYNSTIKDKLPFFGRPLALKRAIGNVISNAVKYASQVWVSMQKNADKIVIYVEDNGPGIPTAELSKVFEAYYRAEYGKAKSSTGSGLGLTIAYEVVHSHDGAIDLYNKAESGLQVVIQLPLQQN